ncbi:MAG: UDP-N-acetylglucosamine 2-epimerase (non-hydrolyzing) [Bacteroidia bacterium]
MQEKIKIISVVGARPNFMKIAPFSEVIQRHNLEGRKPYIEHKIVHTGQHYDARMTDVFFNALSIPKPDLNLQVGSGTHAEQVGNTMIAFEKVLIEEKPDWVVVPGDVNATLACSLAAAKLQIKVCHIEAGLRSDDLAMPEEINRILTDRISSLLLTPDVIAGENLLREGIPSQNIRFVGNIMIDTLNRHLEKARGLSVDDIISENAISKNISGPDEFNLLTLHRPSNVDDADTLSAFVDWIENTLSPKTPVVWVIHPRTENQLKKLNLWNRLVSLDTIFLVHPLSYHQLLKLSTSAKLIITDSGGLQEEATVIGKPCVVLRNNTERPQTLIKNGGTCLLTLNREKELNEAIEFFEVTRLESVIPERWDGKSAERCLEAIISFKSNLIYA